MDDKDIDYNSEGIELNVLSSQTRETLDNLLSRRRDLPRKINNSSHEHIIHSLPPELSSSILFFSLSEDLPQSILDPKSTGGTESQVITTPLTLGAVCRAWRTIAWTSPGLWTKISIPVKPKANREYLSIADDWLKRSGKLPLSMYIYVPRATIPHEDPGLRRQLSEIVTRYLHRCHHLALSCPIKRFPDISGDAPLLAHIKVTSDLENFDINRMKIITLRSTRQDVRFSMTDFPVASLDLPFSNVSSLKGWFSLEGCVSMLKKCSNLTEYQVIGLKDDSLENSTTRGLIHHKLERLTLGSVPFPSDAFLAVNLPSLTHLRVCDATPSSIQNSIHRYGCNLQYLYIDTLDSHGELCDLLRSTISREDLHLVEHNVQTIQGEGLFSALGDTSVIGRTRFLPNLSTLIIKTRDETKFPWGAVAQIFGSLDDIRNPLRRPIKHLQVIYDWSPGNMVFLRSRVAGQLEYPTLFLSKEVIPQFLDIAREGVNIDLQDLYAKEDILMLAMERHNIPVPEWYQIKHYVGISDLDDLDFDYDSSMTDDSEDLEREMSEFLSDVDSEGDEEEEYSQFLLSCL